MNAVLADMTRAVLYHIHRDEPEGTHFAQDLEAQDFRERLWTCEDEREARRLCRRWLRLYAPEVRRV